MQRNTAMTLPVASSRTVASQTCVVRPACVIVHSQMTAPSRTVPRKFVFNSIVVNPVASGGMFASVAYPQLVSAMATTLAAWRYPFGARSSSCTSSREVTTPGRTPRYHDPNEPREATGSASVKALHRERQLCE